MTRWPKIELRQIRRAEMDALLRDAPHIGTPILMCQNYEGFTDVWPLPSEFAWRENERRWGRDLV